MDEEEARDFSEGLAELDSSEVQDLPNQEELDEREPEDMGITPEQRAEVASKYHDDPDEVSSEVADFIGRTGAIELIEILGSSSSGLSFNELRERVPNSSATLSKRLEEGAELPVIHRGIDTNGRGSTPIYSLETGGEILRKQLDQHGILKIRAKIEALEEMLAEQTQQLQIDIEEEFFNLDWQDE
jgi:DNA-binding HxlR family transcriptional regulator